MARNDVYLYTNATSPADAVVTAQQNTTTTDFPDLVVGDAPSFNFYFTDGTPSWPAFAGSGAYTVQWSIGDTVAGDEPPLAFQTQATPITGGWTIRLPLSTGPLINRLRATRVSQEFPVVRLWQQLRVLDADGNPVTYALIRTNVRLRSTPDTAPTSDDPLPAGTSAVLVDANGDLVSPTNFFAQSVSLNTQTSTSGNITVTPSSPHHKEVLTVGGSARTSVIIVGTAGQTAGSEVEVIVKFSTPATANIVLEVRNATSGGTLLATITSDGFQANASFRCAFDGSAHVPLALVYPAYPTS